MTQISAAENLIIDVAPDRWRLIHNGQETSPRVIAEAAYEKPFRYIAGFGRTRRLPAEGALPVDYIREVVVGWSAQDEAWHLGLLLARDLAEARGSRWCELARWPDPDQTVFAALAREAGETLAQTLNRPFDLIRPRGVAATPEPPPLPELPVVAGVWTLNAAPAESGSSALIFTRARRWVTSRLMRGLWYGFLAVVYVGLSVATLQTDLALPNAGTMLPNPELLPYLGLAVAVLLVGMIIAILYELLTQPDRVIVDPATRSIAAYRGTGERWRVPLDRLQAVYVTQVVNRRGKKRTLYHGELNLHMVDGAFKKALEQLDQEDIEAEVHVPAQDGVFALDRFTVQSPLQAAGLHIAESLGGLPCYYDQRTR